MSFWAHSMAESFEASEATRIQKYRALQEFSLGRCGAPEAMQALGIESEEDLHLLMAQAHLPMPRLPDAETRRMVEQLSTLPPHEDPI